MNKNLSASHYKLKTPCRNQYEFRTASLDELLPQEHKARDVWDFVESMDTSICLEYINTFKLQGGRPAIDPKILLSLWIYTILDGNTSARKLEELCSSHEAYKWICGGVSVNRTDLAEFRSQKPAKFDELLTSCLAVMVKANLINDSDFSQDGTRIKANAGFNSYHRKNSLEKIKKNIEQHIKELQAEQKKDPDIYEKRKNDRKQKTAIEKKKRVQEALQNLESAKCEKIINGKRNYNTPTEEELLNTRSSITDPECRKMKMGDGGYRLAYNVQFATALDSRVIYGVSVGHTLDPKTAPILMTQVQERLKKLNLRSISNWIADAAYSSINDIETVFLLFPECRYFAPASPRTGIDPKKIKKTDSEAVKKWRSMIGDAEVEELYKKRCSTAEFTNAQIKNNMPNGFCVRGQRKAKASAILHAIAQNMSRYWDMLKRKACENIF